MLLGPLARQSFTLKSSNPGQPPLCPDPLGNRQTGRPSDPTRISLRPGMGPWEALLPGPERSHGGRRGKPQEDSSSPAGGGASEPDGKGPTRERQSFHTRHRQSLF